MASISHQQNEESILLCLALSINPNKSNPCTTRDNGSLVFACFALLLFVAKVGQSKPRESSLLVDLRYFSIEGPPPLPPPNNNSTRKADDLLQIISRNPATLSIPVSSHFIVRCT